MDHTHYHRKLHFERVYEGNLGGRLKPSVIEAEGVGAARIISYEVIVTGPSVAGAENLSIHPEEIVVDKSAESGEYPHQEKQISDLQQRFQRSHRG